MIYYLYHLFIISRFMHFMYKHSDKMDNVRLVGK